MRPSTIVLLIVLGVLIALAVGLYFLGKKAQKKQEEQQQQNGHGDTTNDCGIHITNPVHPAQTLVALAEILGDGDQRADDNTDGQCANGDQQCISQAFHHPHVAVVLKKGIF